MEKNELIRELAAAGFPFGEAADHAYMPSLEELIEACGDGFKGLNVHPSGWRAWSERLTGRQAASMWDDEGHVIGWSPEVLAVNDCASPDEAVARLWLALHPKQ